MVNGSPWSLAFEVMSYLLLASLWVALRSVTAVATVIGVLGAAAMVSTVIYDYLPFIAYTLPYFAGGVVTYSVSRIIGLKLQFALICVVGLGIAWFLGMQWFTDAILGSYLVAYLGARSNPGSALAARVGDLSYAAYLFGWPIGQLAKVFLGTQNPWLIMAVATPIVCCIAAISCHVIERPALRLKRPLLAILVRAIGADAPANGRLSGYSPSWRFLLLRG